MYVQKQMKAELHFRKNGEKDKNQYTQRQSTLLRLYHSICLRVTQQIKIYPEHLWFLSLPCNCSFGVTRPMATLAAKI